MFVIECLYRLKKKAKKIYKDYFTIEGRYTSLLPDSVYLKKLYKNRMGKELNLKNPITYNEKLNWLKLYDRRDEYTHMVDKYAVREYVKKTIGQDYLIPLIGCWDTVDNIDFSLLPNEFVLKCNHDNGVIICKDKSNLDVEVVKKELREHLKRNYYKKTREWPYKKVKRKVICEKYMEDKSGKGLIDYKFFCFNGRVELLFIATDRNIDTRFDYFDREFNHLPFVNGYPNSDKKIEKPNNFNNMILVAERLAHDIPHVRVDLYSINGKIYFGEMTFFHDAGLVPFDPDIWDERIGKYIQLPKKKWRL